MAGPGRRAPQYAGLCVRQGMYQQQPVRRAGLPVAAIVSIVAAVAILGTAIIVIAVAFIRSPEAAGWDTSTIKACQSVKAEHGLGDNPAAALEAASSSDVPELRSISAEYASDGTTAGGIRERTGAIKISTWCLKNKLG